MEMKKGLNKVFKNSKITDLYFSFLRYSMDNYTETLTCKLIYAQYTCSKIYLYAN